MKENKTTGIHSKVTRLCLCALFAAMICGCTFISIPLPVGYFNLGDAAVIVCAWLLGPFAGCIAAALGSALADIFMGYVIYAPATAVIKALVALLAYFLCVILKKAIRADKLDALARAVSAFLAETVMVGGYFFYEYFLLSYGAGAVASIAGNVLQALCAVIISTLAYAFLRKRKLVKHIFNVTN